jgi:hypothetical protein
MIKKVELTEVKEEGLIKLIGKRVTFFCLNYIYVGDLIGVNESCVLIENPKIVYETGSFTEKTYKDAQSLNVKEWYIQLGTIESFGILKND